MNTKLKKLHSVSTRLGRTDVELLNTDGSKTESIDEIFGRKKGKDKHLKTKGRKELRKEKRLLIKAKQNKSWMEKHGMQTQELNKEQKDKKKRKKKKKKKVLESPKEELETEATEAANDEDDKMIKRMEKKLGLNKKKKLPSSFNDDGLGYLLELCEPMENASAYMMGGEDLESEEEQLSDEEPELRPSKRMKMMKNEKGREKEEKSKKEVKSSNDLAMISEEDEDSIHSGMFDESEEDYMSKEDDDDEEYEEENEDEQEEQDCNDKEDDHRKIEVKEQEKQPLNINIKSESPAKQRDNVEKTKYVPPHLRKSAEENSEETQRLERLRKQLKGLINRLSEANLSSIAQEVEEVYLKNSRNDCNNILLKLILDACVMPTHMPEKMLLEHMMLVAILHAHIGSEIGAFFIQELAQKFARLHSSVADKLVANKECDNVLMLIAQLYNFKVTDSLLIYDLIRELVTSFTEKDIEMLMLLLKSVGAEIRRDDPASLKEIILQVQAKAASMSDLTKQSRVKFMLDVITALRNNNLRKIPQYDPSVIERARKVLKGVIRNKDVIGDMQLRISLKDLLQVKDKGRWWVIGSAWTGRDDEDDMMTSDRQTNSTGYGEIIKIAKQQRMNTEIRKNIFCVMMSSEDYLDCFEKLLRLNLKDKQAREIVHVLIDCCLQEKSYNPYYAFLAQKLCEFSRGNQVTFQYSFWDRFKTISSLNTTSSDNMAKLLAHLFASGSLSLSILKVVGFATIDKPTIKFFVRLFTVLMNEYPENSMRSVFSRIANLPKLSLLREGLKIFIRHFLLTKSKSDEREKEKMKKLIDIAEAALDDREVEKF
eukprot:gene3193-3665_t